VQAQPGAQPALPDPQVSEVNINININLNIN
jgi:hypothetical protein